MWRLILFFGILLFIPSVAAAAVDVSISTADITFSNEKPYDGEIVRIYATVENKGQSDARGAVRFFINDTALGSDQPFSVLVGKTSTVFIDWNPSEGYYNVSAEILNLDPSDGTPDNNKASVLNFLVNKDTDNDGIPDTEDLDDDNDGITDGVETVNGTDPLKFDTDGDGVGDMSDAFPLDPSEQRDADNDGIGDNADTDADNDGIADGQDPAPFDPAVPGAAPEQKPEPVQTPVEKPSAPAKLNEQIPLSFEPTSPPPAPEQTFTPEEVQYTFPDESTADHALDIVIAKSRISWNTWTFDILGADESFIYLWDFGDGALSQDKSPTHSFRGSGDYSATLTVSDATGGLGEAREDISIGFWHLGNPWLTTIIAVLGLLGIGIVIYLIINLIVGKKRKNKK